MPASARWPTGSRRRRRSTAAERAPAPTDGSSSTTCWCWPASCCAPDTADVRAALHQRYQRLLLDEFQDTDPIQIELAVRIAGGAGRRSPARWQDVVVPPGRLFVVGDPKQSI